jgi:uncharacterized membrane protein YoaK (UPF0700 family)
MAVQQSTQKNRIVPLLLLISATTGLIDAVSILGLGKVFTANMTGNIVFLGFALAGAPGFSWPLYIVALLSFTGGAGLGGWLWKAQGPHGRRSWLLWAGTIEAILLGLAAACALVGGNPLAQAALLPMIALTAAAMGCRNATVRQLKVADLTTTVLTLTITGLAADSPAASGGNNPNLGRRLGAVLAILTGALAGALLVLHAGLALPLALAGLITLGATMALASDPSAGA